MTRPKFETMKRAIRFCLQLLLMLLVVGALLGGGYYVYLRSLPPPRADILETQGQRLGEMKSFGKERPKEAPTTSV